MDNSNQKSDNPTPQTPTVSPSPTPPPAPPTNPPPATNPSPVTAQTPTSPPVPPASSQNQTPPPSNNPSASKLPLIIAGVFVIILFLVGGYFIFNQVTKNELENTPAPTTYEVPRETPKEASVPTTSETEMKTFTSSKLKDIGFDGFSLKYPADWIEKSERDDAVGSARLTLSKDEYSIIIQQGPMGGSICVYEGVLPDGPALDNRGQTYTEITTNFGNLRRTEDESGGKIGFSYCQENEQEKGTYGSFTSVGAMSASAPSSPEKEILSELDEIIKSIQTL